MKLTQIYLILIFSILINNSLLADKGEIIIGDTEYISGPDRKYKIKTYKEKKYKNKKLKKKKRFILTKVPGKKTAKPGKKRLKRKYRYIPFVQITVGKNRLGLEKVGQNIKLPISITVSNYYSSQRPKLSLFAKNMASGKTYKIYELAPLQINKRWAQDQLLWNAIYKSNNLKNYLPVGQYQIICSLYASRRNIITYWGKGKKKYYVSVVN